MRKRCLDTVYKMAKINEKVVFIGSDLGVGTLKDFKQEIPERFFMEGVSEGHIVGMAAGLAVSGKIVYVNTIATFLTRRCFEQNIIDLGLTNANVRLIANGGGLVYAPLGPTHLAFEDVAIMRAIPNMTIIAPTDAEEMERAVVASVNHQGPIYFRLAKGGDPVVSKPEHGFTIGKPIMHCEPGEALIIAYGVMVDRALKVAANFATRGIKVGVMNVHTLKPLDEKTIIEKLKNIKAVITAEEHTIIGGLGSAVAEIIAENQALRHVRFKRIALPDKFSEKYGSQNAQLKYYNCDVEDMEKALDNLLGA